MSSLPPVAPVPGQQVFGESYTLSREGLPQHVCSGLNTPNNTPIASGKTTPSTANGSGSGSITPELKRRLKEHVALHASGSMAEPLQLQQEQSAQAKFFDSVQRRLGKLLEVAEVDRREEVGRVSKVEVEGDGVSQLQDLNEDYYQVLRVYTRERRALEARFMEKYAQVFTRRRALCREILAQRGVSVWAVALRNNEQTAHAVKSYDIPLLSSLVDIRVKDLKERRAFGFVLEFEFVKNEFFDNKVLTKTYIVQNLYEEEDPILESAHGCDIQWKAQSKNPAVGEDGKRRESFFDFFNVPFMEDFTKECEGLDIEEYKQLHDKVTEDFMLGTEIQQRVVPRMCDWFVGEEAVCPTTIGSQDQDVSVEEKPES